mgnify:CR=1 FL=1
MIRRADWVGAGLLALVAVAQLGLFALLDRRPANDHDPKFTRSVVAALPEHQALGPAERGSNLVRFLLTRGDSHPRLAATWLLALTGELGWSRALLRASNIPWLVLFTLGVWLLAREVMDPRLALLAAFLALSAPVTVHMSRKFFLHFHAAALQPIALLLVVRLVTREEAGTTRSWAALGWVQGLRVLCHPIVAPDVFVTFVLAAWGRARLAPAQSRRWACGPSIAGLTTVLMLLPFFVEFRTGTELDLSGYVRYAARWVDPAALGLPLGEHLARIAGVARQLSGPLLGPLLCAGVAAGVATVPVALAGMALSERQRAGLTVLSLHLVAQLPVAYVASLNGGFLEDWLFLLPGSVVLALGASAAVVAGFPRVRRALLLVVLALGLGGLQTLVAPLVTSARGPDPLLDPGHYERAGLTRYLHSGHGGVYNTHHLLVRREGPAAVMARMLRSSRAASAQKVATMDLRALPGGGWELAAGELRSLPFPHALLGEGFSVEFQSTAEMPDPGVAIIRLWADPDLGFREGVTSAASVAVVTEAVAWLRTNGGVPESSILQPIEDPIEWLVASSDPDAPRRDYLRVSLLLTPPPGRSARR